MRTEKTNNLNINILHKDLHTNIYIYADNLFLHHDIDSYT